MAIQKPRGTQDFLPEQTANWNYVEGKIKELCAVYGLGEIRTPIFEKTNLFLRGIGETTDVVQKEMYTFTTGDRKKESFTLRPENTAAAVRSYLENKIYGQENITKWFYIGPMFRHDKPQAGRYRQFHQFGVEVLGTDSPYADAEVICLVLQLFKSFGLNELNLELNSVGCPNCRPKYREALIEYFEPHREELCGDCQNRLEKNPLRVLDCKVDGDKGQDAPHITDYLCEECKTHFEKVKELLTAAGVSYNLNSRLVRGLDYYTKTAFEVQYTPLGAQSAVAGGGRYDGLVEELDGPSTPAIGFAVGIERLLLALEKQNLLPKAEDEEKVFVLGLGDAASKHAFMVQQELRKDKIKAIMDLSCKSMKSQLKYANKIGAKYVIIIGDDELARQEAIIRFMDKGEQETVPLKDLMERIKTLVKGC